MTMMILAVVVMLPLIVKAQFYTEQEYDLSQQNVRTTPIVDKVQNPVIANGIRNLRMKCGNLIFLLYLVLEIATYRLLIASLNSQ